MPAELYSILAKTQCESCRSVFPHFGLLCFTVCMHNTILVCLAGGSTLRDMAAAFAAVPARVLWKLTDKERAETAEPGFPALSANVKARDRAGHRTLANSFEAAKPGFPALGTSEMAHDHVRALGPVCPLGVVCAACPCV